MFQGYKSIAKMFIITQSHLINKLSKCYWQFLQKLNTKTNWGWSNSTNTHGTCLAHGQSSLIPSIPTHCWESLNTAGFGSRKPNKPTLEACHSISNYVTKF